ncbi:hypothetical protein AF088_14860, partial [Listeria monocytogenes]|nr:hypothetical protein [Listeria monocytogenes]
KKIKSDFDCAVNIVFITNFPDYVFQSFVASPAYFIPKPIGREEFTSTFLFLIEKIQKTRDSTFCFKEKYTNDFIFIPVVDVTHIRVESAQKRILKICTTNGDYYGLGRLVDAYHQLEESKFVRIHRKIIVNVDCVKRLTYNLVYLDHDENLPISRKY